MTYGAPLAAWDHFAEGLGLTVDLLPVVSNPDATISAQSKMVGIGKTPSRYNAAREVSGFPKWTSRYSNAGEVRVWKREPDYGICLQTRRVRAIDVDVADAALAQALYDAIADTLGKALPKRYRPDSGKFLLAFRLEQDEHYPKRVVPVEGGIVEFLGDGQQFIACGQHPGGVRYVWDDGGEQPRSIPALTLDEVEAVWDTLCTVFASGDPQIARERQARTDVDVDRSDERAAWLADNWPVLDTGQAGELYLTCPFEGEHTTDSGPTATAYFPAGTGGFERGHWRCLHAHCEVRTDAEFDEACGYRYASFAPVKPAAPATAKTDAPVDTSPERHGALPGLMRDTKGNIEANALNLTALVGHPGASRVWIAYDTFLDQIVWAPQEQQEGRQQWRAFTDEHYIALRMEFERIGMKPCGQELLRSCVYYAARVRTMDSAQEWLSRLRWDGTPRIDSFLPDYFGTDDSVYTRSVSAYLWTALAGRVITPGVQADMAPVFIGAQGARKTSAIKAMAPSPEAYVEINLKARDDDLSRKMRGKLVGELEELRGLNSRESEEIKAWVSRTHEEWVPKYKEFGSTFPRRLIFIGSANKGGFLADPTGERRWLPMYAGHRKPIDPEGVAAARDQLWAEAALRYQIEGVEWQDAERLGKDEHAEFKVGDVWSQPISEWLREESSFTKKRPIDGPVTVAEALGGIGIPVSHANQGSAIRVERVFASLGLIDLGNGLWVRERK